MREFQVNLLVACYTFHIQISFALRIFSFTVHLFDWHCTETISVGRQVELRRYFMDKTGNEV